MAAGFHRGVGAVAGWPLAARAQQGEGVRRVGVLTNGPDIEPESISPVRKVLSDELGKLGWIEGRNLQLDFRSAKGDATQTRIFAADLVRLAPDVIITIYNHTPRRASTDEDDSNRIHRERRRRRDRDGDEYCAPRG